MTGQEVTRYARVPAEMSRAGWQRTAPHVATSGQVSGRGTSVSGALGDLAGQLGAMAARAYVDAEPAFWWDADNSALHVVTPDPVTGGHHAWIVVMTGDGPYLSTGTASGVAPVHEALTTAVGLDRIPVGRRPRKS